MVFGLTLMGSAQVTISGDIKSPLGCWVITNSDSLVAQIQLIKKPKKADNTMVPGMLRVQFRTLDYLSIYGQQTEAAVLNEYHPDFWQLQPAYMVRRTGKIIHVNSFTDATSIISSSSEHGEKSYSIKVRNAGILFAASGAGLLLNQIRANNFEPSANLSNIENYTNTTNVINMISYASLFIGGLVLVF